MSRWLHAVVLVLALAASGCASGAELARGATMPSGRVGQPAPVTTDVDRDTSDPTLLGVWRDGRYVVVLLDIPQAASGAVRTEGFAEAVRGIRLVDLFGRTVRTPVESGRRGDVVVARFAAEPAPREVRVLLERGDDLGPERVASRRPAGLRDVEIPDAVPLGSAPVRSIVALSEGAAGTYEVRHGDRREVALPADVLFDTDEAELSPKAGAVVGAAIDTLRTLEPGTEVVVAGNTDDVGDAVYNLDLSRRRAEAVAAAIGAARPAVPVRLRIDARGESRPLVANHDETGTPLDANRALNRRVSLEFQADAGSDTDTATTSGIVVLPDAIPARGGIAVVGSIASATATVDNALGTSTFRLDVTAAERLDGAMRVSFALQNLGGSNPNGDDWVHLFADAARSDGRFDVDDSLRPESASLRSVRVVDGRLLARPLFDDAGLVIGSREFSGRLRVGSIVRLSAWFPAPAAGVTAVELMIPTFGTVRGLPLS